MVHIRLTEVQKYVIVNLGGSDQNGDNTKFLWVFKNNQDQALSRFLGDRTGRVLSKRLTRATFEILLENILIQHSKDLVIKTNNGTFYGYVLTELGKAHYERLRGRY